MKLKKEDYEKFAYYSLIALINDFPQMEKSESPDYTNENIGLEVRRVVSSNDGELDSFMSQYFDSTYKSIPQTLLRKLGFDNHPIQIDGTPWYIQHSKFSGTLFYYEDSNSKELILSHVLGNMNTADDVATSIKNRLISNSKD